MTTKYKNLIFDLDGTLTVHESAWVEAHIKFGTHKEAKAYFNEITRKLTRGDEIDLNEWAEHDVKLWKGASYEKILKSVKPIRFFQGVKRALTTLKAMGYNIYIISGTFDAYMKDVLDRLPEGLISDYVCVKINVDRDGNITDHEYNPLLNDKSYAMNYLADKHGFSLDSTIAIGNGSNDIGMFEVAGFSIAFRPNNKKLKRIADVSIDTENFWNVLRFIRGL